jgi:hypothetical protein
VLFQSNFSCANLSSPLSFPALDASVSWPSTNSRPKRSNSR